MPPKIILSALPVTLIILPHNHTLLLQTKHTLGHIKLSRDILFLVELVSALAIHIAYG